jgi:DNA-directed RNA polymerase
MTLPYGATQQSCRQYTREYIGDNAAAFGLHPDDDTLQWKYAVALTPLVWQAIKDIVKGARAGMDWLQKCASIASAHGIYLQWLSPADFPVYQHYSIYEQVQVKTQLFGEIKLHIAGSEMGLAKYRARNGISPNFVHALDSSHMVFTINDGFEQGLDAMACIHDDYGTHACDTDKLYRIVRETFARMYSTKDWLAAWRMEIQRLHVGLELPEPPAMGNLDVNQVLVSPFFFA